VAANSAGPWAEIGRGSDRVLDCFHSRPFSLLLCPSCFGCKVPFPGRPLRSWQGSRGGRVETTTQHGGRQEQQLRVQGESESETRRPRTGGQSTEEGQPFHLFMGAEGVPRVMWPACFEKWPDGKDVDGRAEIRHRKSVLKGFQRCQRSRFPMRSSATPGLDPPSFPLLLPPSNPCLRAHQIPGARGQMPALSTQFPFSIEPPPPPGLSHTLLELISATLTLPARRGSCTELCLF